MRRAILVAAAVCALLVMARLDDALPEGAFAWVVVALVVAALAGFVVIEVPPLLRDNWHVLASRLGLPSRRAPPHYVRAAFSDHAAEFDAHLMERLAYRAPNLVRAAAAPALGPPPAEILDLGCGTGLCGPLFAPVAARLVGVDLSPEMLAQAARKDCYDALVEADILKWLGAAEERFDLCVAADVLVYFGDVGPVLAGLGRVLRPGARLVFTTEADSRPDWRLTRSGRFAHGRAHVMDRAAAAGFEDETVAAETLRLESEKEVVGDIWVLRRPPAVTVG